MLEDTFLLVEARKDLSTEALVQISLIADQSYCSITVMLAAFFSYYFLTFHSG